MKKGLKKPVIIGTLIIVLGVWIIGNIVLNKTTKIDYNSLDQTDKEMFTELSKIYINFRDNSDKLWDEKYKLNEKPIILVRANKSNGLIRNQAYAINLDDYNKSIFSKKIEVSTSLELPNVYRLSKFEPNTLNTWLPNNFGKVNIKGKDVFYFKYYPDMFENPDLYLNFSSFLLHEAFHTYEQKDWLYDSNDGEYIENYPYDKENYALIGLEFKLLDECMKANNVNEIKNYLREWTIIRTYRYKKWPQLLAETNTEAIEGTARYIEYSYSKLIEGKLTVLAKKQEPYYVTFSEAYNYIANNQAESPNYLERPMRYETGAALGLIMDKANINWKTEIEDSKDKPGKTQYQILKEYFNVSNEDISDENVDKIKNENNYNELIKSGEKIVNLIK
ncbi:MULTISPECIES: hypothetical protein [unclassified Clostridium]|uniref:hypothetical protein n=1 Tax=unclassified Clostridium TaxID=2614128 RepID=UPI0025BCC930|nr:MULTISPECIES: hypothetical protein [unclassified Clostridium]